MHDYVFPSNEVKLKLSWLYSFFPFQYVSHEPAIKTYCKLKKKGKTHRSVLDRHNQDVREIERSVPLDANHNAQSNGNVDMSMGNGKNHIKEEMIVLACK